MIRPRQPRAVSRVLGRLLLIRGFGYSQDMAKPRKGGRTATPRPLDPGAWEKWSTELQPRTVVALKMRAAQERRPMREVLTDAIGVYLATAVRA